MSTLANPFVSATKADQKSRSMGLKFLLIVLLAFVMSIPAFFVDSMVDQRAAAHTPSTASASPGKVMGVPLVDSYRAVTRSLKYITLFLGLVFLTYFLFEISTGKLVHPAQYALVGVAQVIFYLLLLSLSELLGFDLAFLLASGATVSLLSFNAGWVFSAVCQRNRAFVAFGLLYALVYVLLRLQNYALLVGACASFAAIATVMYRTRGLDWYGQAALATPPPATRESWLE